MGFVLSNHLVASRGDLAKVQVEFVDIVNQRFGLI
jgi:hypothetical protein